MVGYDPNVNELPKFAYGLAGGMSGMLTRAVTQPLDVLKIRLQVLYWALSLSFSVNISDLWLFASFMWELAMICVVCD